MSTYRRIKPTLETRTSTSIVKVKNDFLHIFVFGSGYQEIWARIFWCTGVQPFVRSNLIPRLALPIDATDIRSGMVMSRARIKEVEHSSFTPSVTVCVVNLWRCGPISKNIFEATGLPRPPFGEHRAAYRVTMRWLRCRHGYALLRSSLIWCVCMWDDPAVVTRPRNAFTPQLPMPRVAFTCKT